MANCIKMQARLLRVTRRWVLVPVPRWTRNDLPPYTLTMGPVATWKPNRNWPRRFRSGRLHAFPANGRSANESVRAPRVKPREDSTLPGEKRRRERNSRRRSQFLQAENPITASDLAVSLHRDFRLSRSGDVSVLSPAPGRALAGLSPRNWVLYSYTAEWMRVVGSQWRFPSLHLSRCSSTR